MFHPRDYMYQWGWDTPPILTDWINDKPGWVGNSVRAAHFHFLSSASHTSILSAEFFCRTFTNRKSLYVEDTHLLLGAWDLLTYLIWNNNKNNGKLQRSLAEWAVWMQRIYSTGAPQVMIGSKHRPPGTCNGTTVNISMSDRYYEHVSRNHDLVYNL